tara:strand:+ start:13 stop:1344 length:1332 start_codon:yes stop_codon:yes gene_type:complete
MTFFISNTIAKLFGMSIYGGREKILRQKGSRDLSATVLSGVNDNNYLEQIQFDNYPALNENVKSLIITKSFGKQLSEFEQSFRILFSEELNLINQNQKEKDWIKCENSCSKLCSVYIKEEIRSTAYVLRAMAGSLISKKGTITPKLTITLLTDVANLTGVWEQDKQYFKLTIFKNIQKGHLIMGFGPSASGKTYWAKSIIDLLVKTKDAFPSVFLSIDGGIYREQSLIYQSIIQMLHQKHIGGFSNLVMAGINLRGSSLFKGSIVKKQIRNYLAEQEYKPNLYVPETLGGCVIPGKQFCKNYEKYIDLTNTQNDWIGLCVWQHISHSECTFPEEYKCMGCTESGTKREKSEGKKYDSAAWKTSYSRGILHSTFATEWYHIHNSGGYKSYENGTFSKSNIEVSQQKLQSLSSSKLDELENEFNCKFSAKNQVVKARHDDEFIVL